MEAGREEQERGSGEYMTQATQKVVEKSFLPCGLGTRLVTPNSQPDYLVGRKSGMKLTSTNKI